MQIPAGFASLEEKTTVLGIIQEGRGTGAVNVPKARPLVVLAVNTCPCAAGIGSRGVVGGGGGGGGQRCDTLSQGSNILCIFIL